VWKECGKRRKEMENYWCKFNPDWCNGNIYPQFASWIAQVEGDKTSALCRWCNANINVRNMGIGALRRHMERETHKKMMGRHAPSFVQHQQQQQQQPSAAVNTATNHSDLDFKFPQLPSLAQYMASSVQVPIRQPPFQPDGMSGGFFNTEYKTEYTLLNPPEPKYKSPNGKTYEGCIPFKHPFTGICAGPTGSGKTELMKNIILNYREMIKPAPAKIYWYYAESQPKLELALSPVGVEFREGIPELTEFNGAEPTLLIVDDFMTECNSQITKLFTKGSHHRNLSIWFLMQNFFHTGKEIRSITLNAHYIILFKNPRDKQQVKVLGRQMFDSDYQVMEEAFGDATAQPHGYLLVDLKQDTPEHLRLRANILPGQQLAVYVSKKTYKQTYMELTV
jgi:hypothetical protein